MNNGKLAKLRWHCRRGMLELDLLLLPFLEKEYPQLSGSEQAQFEKLLACTDQDLFSWFIGHQIPADDDLANLVERIRLYAQSS